jgi:hypothetical protein
MTQNLQNTSTATQQTQGEQFLAMDRESQINYISSLNTPVTEILEQLCAIQSQKTSLIAKIYTDNPLSPSYSDIHKAVSDIFDVAKAIRLVARKAVHPETPLDSSWSSSVTDLNVLVVGKIDAVLESAGMRLAAEGALTIYSNTPAHIADLVKYIDFKLALVAYCYNYEPARTLAEQLLKPESSQIRVMALTQEGRGDEPHFRFNEFVKLGLKGIKTGEFYIGGRSNQRPLTIDAVDILLNK